MNENQSCSSTLNDTLFQLFRVQKKLNLNLVLQKFTIIFSYLVKFFGLQCNVISGYGSLLSKISILFKQRKKLGRLNGPMSILILIFIQRPDLKFLLCFPRKRTFLRKGVLLIRSSKGTKLHIFIPNSDPYQFLEAYQR